MWATQRYTHEKQSSKMFSRVGKYNSVGIVKVNLWESESQGVGCCRLYVNAFIGIMIQKIRLVAICRIKNKMSKWTEQLHAFDNIDVNFTLK